MPRGDEKSKRKPGFYIDHMTYSGIRQILTNEQKGILLDAIFMYSASNCSETYTGSDPGIQVAFSVLAAKVDADTDSYLDKIEKAKKAAAARWQNNDDKCERMQPDADACECMQPNADHANRIDKNRIDKNNKDTRIQGDQSRGLIDSSDDEIREIVEDLEGMGFRYTGHGKNGLAGWLASLRKQTDGSLGEIYEACSEAVNHDAADPVSYVMTTLKNAGLIC